MKTMARSMTTKMKRRLDGSQEVVMPASFSPWRLGQRIWFRAAQGRIEISTTPQGRRGERRYSRRVRRGMRSLLNDRIRPEPLRGGQN